MCFSAPVSFIAGSVLVAGGVFTWWITARYYRKGMTNQSQELERLRQQLASLDTIEHFAQLLVTDDWEEQEINHQPVWTSESRPTFQIRMEHDDREFAEPWSRGHPDSNTMKFTVNLLINGTIVKTLMFVSLDGGRIVVPLPQRLFSDEEPIYFWDPESMDFKVGKIIGAYYIYKDIEGVAKRCKVPIVSQQRYGQGGP